MLLSYILIIVFLLFGFIATVKIGGKGDEHYDKAMRGNTVRLTLIYVALAVVLLAGLGIYIAI
ncbi:hypothetical protein MUG87_09055 [Ectobacillus sp. JY-23]|uniref:hypothetical protein n=1 Tax=Ectobacillus sp. JY-23 TaxID=2933872 RepID=UPI001FF6B232|nr:hypothetical protein [Ectobacillus sp. JY-23]UOY94219.1 hypothetical protein MUG87_09055 [Ectobacillus sp. JY-23]